jgi:hypothetical protein
MVEEDPTTQELRAKQRMREGEERERAEAAPQEEDTAQHEARSRKAGYLAEKLEERADAEREASQDDTDESSR